MFVGGLSGLGGGAGSALAAKAGLGTAVQAAAGGLGGAAAGIGGQAALGQSPTLGDAGFSMALGVGAALASTAAQSKLQKQAPKPNSGEASKSAAGAAPRADAPARTYDTSDGLLPTDPKELFNKSPDDVMGPPKTARRLPTAPAIDPPDSPTPQATEPFDANARALSDLFGRDLPNQKNLTALERTEVRLAELKAGTYDPPKSLTQADLDYYADVAVNAIFSDKVRTTEALYLQHNRLLIIQAVRDKVP
jgi:hypothetical protein